MAVARAIRSVCEHRNVAGYQMWPALRDRAAEGGGEGHVIAGNKSSVRQQDSVPFLAGKVIGVAQEHASDRARVYLGGWVGRRR